MTINLLTKLVEVHRGWCNYCAGNVKVCDNYPKGGCTLRDYLQSLSQEAVRDEALAVPLKPDIEWLRKVAALCPGMDGTEDMVGVVRGVHGAILATALKREPNAAALAHPGGIASSASPLTRGDLQDATDRLSKPAPAAPDVKCCCAAHHPNYGRCLQCPIHGTLPSGASDD